MPKGSCRIEQALGTLKKVRKFLFMNWLIMQCIWCPDNCCNPFGFQQISPKKDCPQLLAPGWCLQDDCPPPCRFYPPKQLPWRIIVSKEKLPPGLLDEKGKQWIGEFLVKSSLFNNNKECIALCHFIFTNQN